MGIVDTIGAGDSFTATVMVGLLNGMESEEIIEAALEIAGFVCSCSGATPDLPEQLRYLIVARNIPGMTVRN